MLLLNEKRDGKDHSLVWPGKNQYHVVFTDPFFGNISEKETSMYILLLLFNTFYLLQKQESSLNFSTSSLGFKLWVWV